MLLRFTTLLSVFICGMSLAVASSLKNIELRDLYFGEVLFYAHQGMYFDALVKLDTELSQHHLLDEPELDPFHKHLGHAEFSVGDIEIRYRMDQRAGRAIQAVLDSGVDQATRNHAALALARVFYNKNEPQNALHALQKIRQSPDKYDAQETNTFKAEVAYLRALASIDVGQFSVAVISLKALKNEKKLRGFVLYNLGIALIQSGKEQQGIEVLDELGRMDFSENRLLALKDKTNLKLAYRYLEKGEAKQAQKYFEHVRLDGPYSNRALLGAGWVAIAQGRYDRALVPWSMLHKRAKTNYSVQETLMAVPYAYSKLNAYGRAANLYDYAMDVFAVEIIRLDESIHNIRKGKFLTALLDDKADKDRNWVVNLRELPDAPETRYILELMASHDFQQSYKNLHDLADLRQHLDKGLADLIVYEEMIEIRRRYQEPLLPVVEKEFKKLDARIKLRLEQRNNLASKIKNMLVSPRPEHLATSDERQALNRIMALKEISVTNPQLVDAQMRQRINRLRGVLLWRVESEYDQRLTDAYNNLVDLDEVIKKLKSAYNSFIRTRQAATQSYEGYTIPIRQLRTRLFAAQRKLKSVAAKQGRMLEAMAIHELDSRRKRLEDYQIKARFALAESYDRATKAQVDAQVRKQRQLQLDSEKKAAQANPIQSEEKRQQTSVNDSPVQTKPVDSDSSLEEKVPGR